MNANDPLADLPWPGDPPDCCCMELGSQICHTYENWCDEVGQVEWWNNLTREERQAEMDSWGSYSREPQADDLLWD